MAHHFENWHRALDVQMELHKWSLTKGGATYHQGFIESVLTFKGTRSIPWGSSDQLAHNLTETLWRGDTIYITADMQHVLLQAAHDLPDDIEFDDHILITPTGFCLFEEPMYGEDLSGATIAVHAIAWQVIPVSFVEDSEPGTIISMYFFTDPRDPKDEWNEGANAAMQRVGVPVPPLVLNHYYPAIVGFSIPVADRPAAELIVGLLKLFMAMQYLAQQTIGEPMRMRPPRAVRRRAISWDRDQERYITLITLRRKSVKKDDHEPQTVEWSHRWVVKGHWRRQYYPKTKTYGWKYIYEYVKGPEDKPLLIRERRVFNFRR